MLFWAWERLLHMCDLSLAEGPWWIVPFLHFRTSRAICILLFSFTCSFTFTFSFSFTFSFALSLTFLCFSISIVYPPNKIVCVIIQKEKWSAHQGASFGMVSSHFWKNKGFRPQYFRQLAIDFPIKISYGICSKELLAMKNRFLTFPKSETFHFDGFLTI